MCWHEEFFHSIPETYDCLKKLCCYVLYYGPAYITEIYHYLNKSQLLEKNFDGRHIQVLSLGCGFGPDAYALEKYIEDNNLDISFTYTGYDVAEKWADIRENYPNRSFEVRDLLSGFSLENYDIIFMCKVFSTIKKNSEEAEKRFLRVLMEEIDNMKDESFLIFNDINNSITGRDDLDKSISDFFSEIRRYYFPHNGAFTRDYVSIGITHKIRTPLILGTSICPKREVSNSIIFEYRK